MLNVETFVSEILQSLCLQGIAEESGGDEGDLPLSVLVSIIKSHKYMILCGIFLTQGSSVMLWRHLKQTPTLVLFKNCSSLFSNQWGDQILSRQFPNFIQFYFSHKISLTNPDQNWICKSQPSTKNNPHIHQISHLQNPVIIDLLI